MELVFDEVFDEVLELVFDEVLELVFDEVFELVFDEVFELVFDDVFELDDIDSRIGNSGAATPISVAPKVVGWIAAAAAPVIMVIAPATSVLAVMNFFMVSLHSLM